MTAPAPSRRVAFRQAAVSRAIRGAAKAGVSIGRIEVVGDRIIIIPVDAMGGAQDAAADLESRMIAAFGE